MASVSPLRGIRYDPGVVPLGDVLAPPYDVISDAQREELYARDLRNVVRIDYGREYPGDVPGENDRYSRAAGHLQAWRDLGVLVQDTRPAIYVHEHYFTTLDGRSLSRRGLLARVRALPWGESDVLPHEHTLRGPKEDRLRLMRATRAQTSAVLLLWDSAPGIDAALEGIISVPETGRAMTEGEVSGEGHRFWVVDDPEVVRALTAALEPARLYMADGHHRFETAAAYAAERRAEDPGLSAGDDSQWTLASMCAATDPAMELLPTHRLVRPGPGLPGTLAELLERLDHGFEVVPRATLAGAAEGAAELLRIDGRVAIAVSAGDGAAILHRPRPEDPSPRNRLDVTAVEADILVGACGLDAERIAGGALAYTRTVAGAEAAVRAGEAALAIVLNACSTQEMIDVSDAGEQMPQKSTYFYPKVPTGLVLNPL